MLVAFIIDSFTSNVFNSSKSGTRYFSKNLNGGSSVMVAFKTVDLEDWVQFPATALVHHH